MIIINMLTSPSESSESLLFFWWPSKIIFTLISGKKDTFSDFFNDFILGLIW